MSSVQNLLSEYLQCEQCHTHGAYRVAVERLDELARRLSAARASRASEGDGDSADEKSGSSYLSDVVGMARANNRELGRHRHASAPATRPDPARRHGANSWPARDPLPEKLPLSRPERFKIGTDDDSVRDARAYPWPERPSWDRVPRFYSQAIEALVNYDKDAQSQSGSDAWLEHRFAESLFAPRDRAAGEWEDQAWRKRRAQRIERYRHRREQAHHCLAPGDPHHNGIGEALRGRLSRALHNSPQTDAEPGSPAASQQLDQKYPTDSGLLEQIVTGNLSTEGDSLPLYVIRVQAEAHLSMHAVEAWQSMCLGEHAESLNEADRGWLHRELDRSIVLFTFAHCVSRTAPWIFAEDDAERECVFEDFSGAWENVIPTRCMWIAARVSLLSLHRRGYARSLQGDSVQAYNDYHKLQQLIRDAERRLQAAPILVEGAFEFLAGLDAEAHHHIGELYRSEHAHRPALKHFEAASYRLERLSGNGRMGEVLINSRWRVQLQISRGKACYEMGRQKEALYWHLHAWRMFLELLAADTHTETNTAAIEDAIDWLERIKFEPELRKSEVSTRLRPVVDQLARITVVSYLGALAAEILLRLGHLLFVLNVGFDNKEVGEPQSEEAKERIARERIRRTLAFTCLAKAAECDPHSTLIGADLLKARFRFNEWQRGPLPPEYSRQLQPPQLAPVAEHWPRGGNDYEQLARVAEYLMLKARVDRFQESLGTGNEPASDAFLARDLLLSLFMSTDSINVRKSQIHRFLMKSAPDGPMPGGHHAPAVELVCMRRYSSPFPLLPRPSAFRALGGGYFVRLHRVADKHEAHEHAPESGPSKCPFGIVVDPGVDFVENLYRTGYALSDIDMIVLTHDHVDHLGALEPLLSLIHVRFELLSKQARIDPHTQEGPRVKLLVSQSVFARFETVKQLMNSREFEFACLEDSLVDGTLDRENPFFEGFPPEFEILAMSSAAANGKGHLDLSERPSHGLCFRVCGEEGASVAITSDTPRPPASATDAVGYKRWSSTWQPALAADVLVVHLGSVPLTELRRIDSLGAVALGPPAEVPECDQASLQADEQALISIRARLQQADDHLQGHIEYAQWLRSHVPKGEDPLTAELVGPVPPQWLPPQDHNYLAGLLVWSREYLRAHPGFAPAEQPDGAESAQPDGRPGLFVVGELSEELGTMRGKVASRLNEQVFRSRDRRKAIAVVDSVRPESGGEPEAVPGFSYALTADIGLHVCVTSKSPGERSKESCVKVLCTTCDLDTDRAPNERYHLAHDVYEVCVKGENEGIFYNCLEHDPARQSDPTFLEQLERFDIFGR